MMAPAIHLALALLLFPTLILSEPLHVPLTRRRQTKLTNWTDQANKIRYRYGYPLATSQSRRSNRRASAGIPVLDQVHIVIVFYFILNRLITRIGCRFFLHW
jgi:hypothetical protein